MVVVMANKCEGNWYYFKEMGPKPRFRYSVTDNSSTPTGAHGFVEAFLEFPSDQRVLKGYRPTFSRDNFVKLPNGVSPWWG